tara:strand:- start:114 stop:239 length:126 start_codon:yes stop_codon:yes gene_type:complete
MFDIEHAILFLFISIPFGVIVMYFILKFMDSSNPNDDEERR